MIPLKEKYKDENELINEFCKRSNCSKCNGSDDSGEPNGYGCDDMENFINENYNLITTED